jgi:hypothetical protein
VALKGALLYDTGIFIACRGPPAWKPAQLVPVTKKARDVCPMAASRVLRSGAAVGWSALVLFSVLGEPRR